MKKKNWLSFWITDFFNVKLMDIRDTKVKRPKWLNGRKKTRAVVHRT
jgi:hypothetical protein